MDIRSIGMDVTCRHVWRMKTPEAAIATAVEAVMRRCISKIVVGLKTKMRSK